MWSALKPELTVEENSNIDNAVSNLYLGSEFMNRLGVHHGVLPPGEKSFFPEWVLPHSHQNPLWGAWVAQLLKHSTSAQVRSSSHSLCDPALPASDSVLTVWNLLRILSLLLSLPLPHLWSLSLSK